jgi:acyl carrier protein
VAEIKQFTHDEIVSIVNEIMVEEFEVEDSKLAAEAKLSELGLDSLDGVDMVVAIEKAFRFRIPEDEARTISTLGDIYTKVETRLEELKEAV